MRVDLVSHHVVTTYETKLLAAASVFASCERYHTAVHLDATNHVRTHQLAHACTLAKPPTNRNKTRAYRRIPAKLLSFMKAKPYRAGELQPEAKL